MSIPEVQREITTIERLITETIDLIEKIQTLTKLGYHTNALVPLVGDLERHAIRLRFHVAPHRRILAYWHSHWARWHADALRHEIATCEHILDRVA